MRKRYNGKHILQFYFTVITEKFTVFEMMNCFKNCFAALKEYEEYLMCLGIIYSLKVFQNVYSF